MNKIDLDNWKKNMLEWGVKNGEENGNVELYGECGEEIGVWSKEEWIEKVNKVKNWEEVESIYWEEQWGGVFELIEFMKGEINS